MRFLNNVIAGSRIAFVAIVTLTALLSFQRHAEAQDFTGGDPERGELGGFPQYLQASAELRLKILSLQQQLDECGACSDHDALQSELEDAVNKRNTIRKGEGIALETLGLPGDNFEDFLYRMRTGLVSRPPEGLRFDEQLRRTAYHYCLAKFPGEEENKKCRVKYFDDSIRADAAEAKDRCFREFGHKYGWEALHTFPAPDADAKKIRDHQVLWIKFEACIKNKNQFDMMRVATNKACGFEDLSANLNDDDFLCACAAIPAAQKTNCPEDMTLPDPVIPSFNIVDDPAFRMLDPDGYGPALMGIRLGQPVSLAERTIRKRMEVASVYELPSAQHPWFGPDFGPGGPSIWPIEIGGRMFVNKDGSEFTIISTVRNLPGRVFALTHASLLPEGAEVAAEKKLVSELGPPSARSTGFFVKEFWGNFQPNDLSCLPGLSSPLPTEWKGIDGQVDVVSKHAANLDYYSSDWRQFGLFGTMTSQMRTSPLYNDDKMYKCPTFIFSSIEVSTGRDKKMAGAPVLLNEMLIDPAMLRWYELEQRKK